jgi:hypothetical protein
MLAVVSHAQKDQLLQVRVAEQSPLLAHCDSGRIFRRFRKGLKERYFTVRSKLTAMVAVLWNVAPLWTRASKLAHGVHFSRIPSLGHL